MSILFKGNLEEGNYTLIKSTNGWVLKGETAYVGFNFADRPQKVVAQITFDEEKLCEIVKEAVERFKKEYEVIDRPQGKWIYCEDDEGQDGYKCSECGFFVPWYYGYEDINYIYKYHACPSCFARMI